MFLYAINVSSNREESVNGAREVRNIRHRDGDGSSLSLAFATLATSESPADLDGIAILDAACLKRTLPSAREVFSSVSEVKILLGCACHAGDLLV